jgi:4-hydroxybenzoyl-CoA reductase subunit beta
MLRLPKFEVAEPSTVDEAVALLAQHGDRARPMAGGTDLMPNMKHEIETPEVVVGLWRIDAMRTLEERGPDVHIGALWSLHDLQGHPLIRREFPSLVEAVSQVAGPQLRRMGTIGGNVCLDTRCVYINQSHFWRQALGFCLKKDGTVCHVVAGGRNCVAAASNDSAPVLMTLGARLRLESSSGTRELSVEEFYHQDGIFNQSRRRDEILTEIIVPKSKPGTISAYKKLRTRAAIDFPELGVAVLAVLDGGGRASHLDVCVTALASRPIRVGKLEPHYQGRVLDDAVIEAIAEAARVRCKPLKNIATEPSYRREMVKVYVKRALQAALSRRLHALG